MDDAVRRELETLKGMVLNWKQGYLGWAPPGGGCGFLAEDLRDEIENCLYPYVRRMFECAYLSASEVRDFLEECMREVEDLRRELEGGA